MEMTPSCGCLVVNVKSHTVNNNIVQEPGMSGHNQDKLEVVKQEMARVNMDILGISELKWTGMSEFNSTIKYI